MPEPAPPSVPAPAPEPSTPSLGAHLPRQSRALSRCSENSLAPKDRDCRLFDAAVPALRAAPGLLEGPQRPGQRATRAPWLCLPEACGGQGCAPGFRSSGGRRPLCGLSPQPQKHTSVRIRACLTWRKVGVKRPSTSRPSLSADQTANMSPAQVGPWAGCPVQVCTPRAEGHHLPFRASGPAASCARREPQRVLAVCAHRQTSPQFQAACQGAATWGSPVRPPVPARNQGQGRGSRQDDAVGASLRTLLGTHTWLAQGGPGPRQTCWRGRPPGAWLLPGSTCSWDCGWAAARLPPWATSFPGTEQGRFPPDRTFGHRVQGARPGGF